MCASRITPDPHLPDADSSGITYILPIRSSVPAAPEMGPYLRWLAARTEIIVIDGSSQDVFAAHAVAWRDALAAGLRHAAPAPELASDMGKVGGVLTGLRLASHARVIIADDDVRYDEETLAAVAGALEAADVVRPQNYFDPVPWHAWWDTGRMLLNRVLGGDWPGTLGVRRAILDATGGYDGRAMFENLELVRTVVAAGGREAVLYDVLVRRRPSTTRHFWSQRVRQAYDEIARPGRMVWQLTILPAAAVLVATGRWRGLAAAIVAIVAAAAVGRWRGGGWRAFPATAPLAAPLWVTERAVCVWLALGARLVLGGVPYRGRILRHAATPLRVLRTRYASLREQPGP